MAADSRTTRWLTRLAKLHLLVLVLPVGFQLLAAANALRTGFQPAREHYGPDDFPLPEQLQKLREKLPARAEPGDAVFTVWGLSEKPGRAPRRGEDRGLEVALALAGLGFEVRVHEEGPLGEAAGILEEAGIALRDEPLEAAREAFALFVCRDDPQYIEPDLPLLASVMRRPPVPPQPWLYDCVGRMDSTAAAEAGLRYNPFGLPGYPAWLDPEFRDFVEILDRELPEDATVLLVPLGPIRTYAARARWFLHLNYFLQPRRFFLHESWRASGTVTQYQDWLAELVQGFRAPPDTPLIPAASLAAARRRTGATHELHYRVSSDFQLGDWRLVTLRKP